jgi:hypothetical protein
VLATARPAGVQPSRLAAAWSGPGGSKKVSLKCPNIDFSHFVGPLLDLTALSEARISGDAGLCRCVISKFSPILQHIQI